MEQNLGPSVVGDQASGWLYKMTLKLSNEGVHLTYSGDSPFLMKLFLGKSCEYSEEFPTKIPLHVVDPKYLPTLCDGSTGLRTDVPIPFRSEVPKTALVYCKDIRCVCPDATHMITRIVENDIRKLAQILLAKCDKSTNESVPLKAFEDNLTARDAKRPIFQFSIKDKQIKEISLSGINALAVIADKEELKSAKEGTIGDLFDGVWTDDEVLMGSGEGSNEAPAKALKTLYPDLFNKRNSTGDSGFISVKDAWELLRKSLNQCAKLLRAQNFNPAAYKRWSEIYYQTNLLIFGVSGLTSYKLKLLIMPQLVEGGFVRRPFDHMTEALEKSNHDANKDYHTKTMRGGGRDHNKDPLYLEAGASSFCKFLKIYVQNSTPNIEVATALDEVATLVEATVPGPKFEETCDEKIIHPQIPIGARKTTETLLEGLRFHVVGNFSLTMPGYSMKINQSEIIDLITEMGGTVLKKDAAMTLINSHSSLPNCFVILKDKRDLLRSTGKPSKGPSQWASSQGETSGSESQSLTTTHLTPGLPKCAPMLKILAGAELTFLKCDYIFDVKQRGQILDPYSAPYLLTPGQNTRKNWVNDTRPLLLTQCSGKEKSSISATTAVKRRKLDE